MIQRYKSLDGLRAYSAFAILMMHVLENSDYFNIEKNLYAIVEPFKWLVYIFMIISGFSLCCGYYEKMLNQSVSIVDFYIKRYFRILPFFAILVIIDCLLNLKIEFLFEGFADLTLVFALLPNASISVVGVGWFLGVVFLFYMLFPFFCFLFRNKRSAWITFAVSVFYNISGQLYFFDNAHVLNGYQKHTNFLFCAMFFCAGGLIYLYRDNLKSFVKSNRIIFDICLFAVTFTCICCWSYVPVLAQPFVCLLVFGQWVIFATCVDNIVLNNRYVSFVSTISMEIYLCHMFVYRAVEKTNMLYLFGHGIVGYVVTLTLTFFGSVLLSYTLQRMIRLMLHKNHYKIYIN